MTQEKFYGIRHLE